MFNIFRKTQPSRVFTSDADDFSTSQIDEWMKTIINNPNCYPDSQDDEYVSGLIMKLGKERFINIDSDSKDSTKRIIELSVKEDGGPDYSTLSYALFNPNVLYITTSPYAYAGSAWGFNEYCNSLMSWFPYIQIGAKDIHSQYKSGMVIDTPMFAIRIMVPLMGTSKDYEMLKNAIRSIGRWGYMLKDGFHTQSRVSPFYALSDMQEQNVQDSVTAAEALFGKGPWTEETISAPACISNSVLKEGEKTNNDGAVVFHYTGNTLPYPFYISAFKGVKYTWQQYYEWPVEITEENEESFWNMVGKYNWPIEGTENRPLGLYRAYTYNNGEKQILKIALASCIPNELLAKVVAWQIAQFQNQIKVISK